MAVYKHKGKFMYDFWKNGVRYREGKYLTRPDAVDTEAKEEAQRD